MLSWSWGSADPTCWSRATQHQQDRGGAGETSFLLRLQTKNPSPTARAKLLAQSWAEAHLLTICPKGTARGAKVNRVRNSKQTGKRKFPWPDTT